MENSYNYVRTTIVARRSDIMLLKLSPLKRISKFKNRYMNTYTLLKKETRERNHVTKKIMQLSMLRLLPLSFALKEVNPNDL